MTPDESYIQLALQQARLAAEAGEVPVGAIVVYQGEVVGAGQNRVLRTLDPTAHAEIVALRAAAQHLDNYRLTGCQLYTTLEPCSMCAGAIIHARIRRLVYAAPDPKAGACGSVLSVLNHPSLNHKLELLPGLLAEECGTLLTNFFRKRRLEKSSGRILGKEGPTQKTFPAKKKPAKKASKKSPKKSSPRKRSVKSTTPAKRGR
jgi:tRNA(Arg) A34 adenosine deaminase TadA